MHLARVQPTSATALSVRRKIQRGVLSQKVSFASSHHARRGGALIRRHYSWQAPVLGYVIGCSWVLSTTSCDAVAAVQTTVVPTTPSILSSDAQAAWTWKAVRRKARRAFRILVRLVKLAFALGPVIAFYPLLVLTHERDTSQDAHNIVLAHDSPPSGVLAWYLHMCLHCVEMSGAAVIKLMQWAGSRPDLFGHDFCSVFSALQDNTTPHSWKHTVKVLEEAFGPDWRTKIRLHEILGSGCIGQVYLGEIVLNTDVDSEQNTEVAVKILHPNVEEDIDADLDLMRLAVRGLRMLPMDVFSNLKWLNLEGVVEEFAALLKGQLDLRTEASNLERFHENFQNDPNIVFPQLVPGYTPTTHVLVETYCPGVPVLQFARENQHNPDLLATMCKTAVRAVCKMIFLDNYMHGDLHPGNVFVSHDGQQFIVLDVGIVTEYNDKDHEMLVDILASFIRKDGRKAGRLLIDDSYNRLLETEKKQIVLDEERYIDKIEALTIRASGKNYFMEHLGTYISYICEAAAAHHVMMNQSFVTAALAVKVEEGIALALDPSIEIWKIAIPIIVQSESRRKVSNIWQVGWIEGIFGPWSDRDAK